MEIFAKKKFWVKLLISLIVVITIYNFSAPTFVRADFGGALLPPLTSLLVALGDGLMWGIQKGLFDMSQSFLHLTIPGKNFWSWVLVRIGSSCSNSNFDWYIWDRCCNLFSWGCCSCFSNKRVGY